MNKNIIPRRRALIKSAAFAATASSWMVAFGVADETKAPQHSFLLSQQGCGRATGYAESNKIVTVGDRTHVAWLDSPSDGFRVRIRTLDHSTGTWTPTYTIGEAQTIMAAPRSRSTAKGFCMSSDNGQSFSFTTVRTCFKKGSDPLLNRSRQPKNTPLPSLVCSNIPTTKGQTPF